ncbi:hypothetical protein MPH_07758 [Macrophomina phaseolina MS6]|uniref:N-acetyltransferase domain-containing protein n=1 Tax=Macrophomina phaseolina (strain MS6) TaxID=1126212 RepID=K2SE05_MACPH|nr:hypothetical protein MPH_07758 [Macrophomina phaseolina MS6]
MRSPTDAGRRVALEIYETRGEGVLTQLDVYAIEQLTSLSSGSNVIVSKQIGSCTGQIFDRERALNNSFNVTMENSGIQIRTFVQSAYDECGTLLSELVEPDRAYHASAEQRPQQQQPDPPTPTANRELIGEHSFLMVEGISVHTRFRRQGIGGAMLAALQRDALAIQPRLAFAVSWPCASDVDLADMGFAAGARLPRPGLGQRRAEDFHRAVGFRALGMTRFWAKRLAVSRV